MKKYCGSCEASHEVVVSNDVREYKIKETNVSARITILKCAYCGNEIYDKANEIENDIILFDEYKKKNNLLTSREIIEIRQKYGLSQATFSKILGFGLKTITRYENGSIQDSTHDSFLRLLREENNFILLWTIKKHTLTESEISKIQSKFFKQDVPSIDYEFKEPCYNKPYVTITTNGGYGYDGH